MNHAIEPRKLSENALSGASLRCALVHPSPIYLGIRGGVRREGVTEAAGKLQKLGVIEYNRGRITVLDRPRLEQLCCECYAVVKRETDRLLPPHLQR